MEKNNMNKDLRERLEEAAIEYGKGFKTSLALEAGFLKGAEFGYKEAIVQAKKWLIEHTACDVECNENGEPLADSYIESRKLAMEIADGFEAEMCRLWERADNE